MNIEKLKDELERTSNQMVEGLDSDSFATWKDNPVTKLFFNDMQLVMVDRMKDIIERQPLDDKANITQAKDRGYYDCLGDILDWSFIEEEEEY